jgi:hypothetical protein
VTPSFVAVGVAAADASGLFTSLKETLAGVSEVAAAHAAHLDLDLFTALATDRSVPRLPEIDEFLGKGSKETQLANFKAACLDQVRAAVALVASKGTSAETDAYRNLLVRVAERAANAAKEGGFLGLGGVRVSAQERAFIDSVRKSAGIE